MTVRKLGDVLEEVKRPVAVNDHETYRILGVRWYAQGVWVKSECRGSEIKALKLFRVETGDFIYNRLFAWKGSFAVVPPEFAGCFVSGEFPVFRARAEEADPEYVLMLLTQPSVWEKIERDSAGVASISRKRLKVPDFLSLELPLPRRELQQRLHTRYVRVERHVRDMVEAMTRTRSDITELRRAILELAVMGRLVPQDPSEEPASELLKRFRAERELLIAEGLAPRPGSAPLAELSEVPFGVPSGWVIERLGNCSLLITKGATPTSYDHPYQSHGIRFVKVENIAGGRIDHDTIHQYISEATNDLLRRSQLAAGDVLFSIAGTIGKTSLVMPEDVPANTNQALAIIRGTARCFEQRFLMLLLDSGISEGVRSRERGGAMGNVSLGDLRYLAVPIPPRAEQKRIIARVDELMALCDGLEDRVRRAQVGADNLLSAIIYGLVSGAVQGGTARD